MLSPVKPSIMTDFFASRAANETMRCDNFLLNSLPKVSTFGAPHAVFKSTLDTVQCLHESGHLCWPRRC